MPTLIDMPLGLAPVSAADPMKQQQWKRVLVKNKSKAPDLEELVVVLQGLVGIA